MRMVNGRRRSREALTDSMASPTFRKSIVSLGVAAFALANSGCAARQFVPIEIEPAPTEVFLDREPVELENGGLELRADRPHVLYFKRDGYQPLPIVIESREGAEGPQLSPAVVRARLRPRVQGDGDVSIEEAVDDAR